MTGRKMKRRGRGSWGGIVVVFWGWGLESRGEWGRRVFEMRLMRYVGFWGIMDLLLEVCSGRSCSFLKN
jgi:hypothetical protein